MNQAMALKGFPDFWDSATPVPRGGTKAQKLYFYLKRVLPRRYSALNGMLSSLFVAGAYRTQFLREQDAFLEVLKAEAGCTCYFDGCKSVPRAQLMLESYPQTKILHLIRDPRGYIASCVKHFKEQTGKLPNSGFVDTRLDWWKKYNTLAAGYEQELAAGKYLRLQYGRLLAEPEEALERIRQFFELSSHQGELGAFGRERLHISGNKTNLVSNRIERGVLGDWRKYGNVVDFQRIEKQARDLPFVDLEDAA
jgi:hypothetical protein